MPNDSKRTIDVLYAPQCKGLMEVLEIAPYLAKEVINKRDRGLVSDGLDRIVAASWLGDERIILVDSIVTQKRIEENRKQVRFEQVTAQLVIELRSELPSGRIDREMSMEDILAVVAESFGHPVTCHPEEPPAALYAGRWDGKTLNMKMGGGQPKLCISGSFYPDQQMCELVWSFDLDRYWNWSLRRRAWLTFDRLVAISRTFAWRFPDIKPTSEAIQYNLAATVLRAFLGDSWCNEQLPGDLGAHPRFQQAGVNSLKKMKTQAWTVGLAEMVFNLQAVAGFENRLKQFPRVDLESAVAELEGARLLALGDVPFKFVTETQQKGCDYDALVFLPSGAAACCEMKCKVDTTPLGHNTVQNSLKKASKQIPSSSPGIIFMKIPEGWVSQPEIKETMEAAVDGFFRNSQRVQSLIIFWDEWHQTETGSLLRLAKFREMTNSYSRFPQKGRLLKTYDQTAGKTQWRQFAEVVAVAKET